MIQVELKVQPSSRKKDIIYSNDGGIKVYLHSAPENNKANKELIKYLADKLNISKVNIKIIRGKTSNIKTLEIKKVNIANFRAIVS